MKTFSTLTFYIFISITVYSQRITRVEPLSWWVGMKTPLTLMFYGENLQGFDVSVMETGIEINRVRQAESPNYLFVDVSVDAEAKAGDYTFVLKRGKTTLKQKYTLAQRRSGSAERRSFSSADMVYLLMPDRFANGDSGNDSTSDTSEKADRKNLQGRHGGDLQGMIDHLDYIADLGATAIWSTPLLLDNEPAVSYHGDACADYYHIDPRYGSNELYKTFVAGSHQKGLKVIFDVVTNHCGRAHWWIKDLPYRDWIHQFDKYTPSNHVASLNMDPNASAYDTGIFQGGWFDTIMPDMNLNNADLLQYFKQYAVWWIEYADLDGLRVDTYPYNEKIPMSEWCKAIVTEYPNMNIVGECWTYVPSQLAYWEKGAMNRDGFHSNLPSVMDFPLYDAITKALSADSIGWNEGMTFVYQALSNDFLFEDPNRLLIMAANHDTERIADVTGQIPGKAKIVAALLATLRGTPQIFSGDELMFVTKDKAAWHAGLRVDFPGGWKEDSVNLFDPSQRNGIQKTVFNYYRKLFSWRRNEEVIHTGKTMHFVSPPLDNTYAYIRYNGDCAVFVFINASKERRAIDWNQYSEVLNKYGSVGKDVVTEEDFSIGENSVEGMSSLVVKFRR
jgi:glycosidase